MVCLSFCINHQCSVIVLAFSKNVTFIWQAGQLVPLYYNLHALCAFLEQAFDITYIF